jgi:predicted RNA-binding Zn-ribbon protein involved in translation (DUF1610 family)
MEPEIARRCLSCGASVRGAAHFCPQCGQAMADVRDEAARPRSQPALVEEAERVASTLEGRLAARGVEERRSAETDARAEPPREGQGARPAAAAAQPATSTARSANAQSPPPAGATPAAGRAGAGESLRPRVDRLRERSVVVLDGAADDPGLRFVLVAVALSVVALLLYVFSFVLR